MDIVRSWRETPPDLKGAVLAIGNFDGVHRGHQAVLGVAKAIAAAEGRKAGAVIFEPHPREFFAPGSPFFRLTPLPVKLELLEALGLDVAFVLPFDKALADLSADAFAADVLGEAFGARHVVVGYDFTYGKGRAGTVAHLAASGETQGYGVDVVEPVRLGGEMVFASSAIRDHLFKGRVRDAAEQLGYWWRVRGAVAHGAGRGQGLGFPTVNFALLPGQDVCHGIYAMRVHHAGGRHDAAGYVGPRPTFGAGEPALEAFLFDFSGELYDQTIEVEFIDFIRPDETFASAEALAAQMDKDCEAARAVLAGVAADDPMRRFPLGAALATRTLDCGQPGC
ncbi:MAG: bifunctional riboflavin kinase/FAD synthetase [Methyloceanibacter sp.]|jgi:riboflavin kinase/FMN adenylyltransferase|uniref:bifunctional riboflavin kinase/FAD synthetase n=1 Tax=Methyloceanibacter sp. TaxID=1965321 RepID=UPI003C5771DE